MSDEHCKRCGKPYKRKRYWQRFCSNVCKTKFHAEERKAAFEALKEKREGGSENR